MLSKNYFNYLLKSNKALIIVIALVSAINVFLGNEEVAQTFSLGISIVLCFILPILTFKYVHDGKAVDSYYSLPIKRKTLLITGLFYCIVLVLVPYLISNIMIVLLNVRGVTTYETVVKLAIISLSFVALIIFNTYIFLLANNTVDGIIVLGAYTALPLALYLCATIFSEIFVCGYHDINTRLYCYLSPAALSVSAYADEVVVLREIVNFAYVVVFGYLLLKSFVERKVERAGKTSNGILAYPTLINIYVLLILFSIGFSYAKESSLLEFLSDNFILYLLVFILYVVFSFIYKRKLYMDIKMPIYFVAIVIVSLLLTKVTYANEAFGLSNKYPKYDNNTKYEINMYTYSGDNDIEKWVENKTGEETDYFNITISAYDKKGLNEYVVNIFESYRKEAISNYYKESEEEVDARFNLYVYRQWNDASYYSYGKSYTYSIDNKILGIDELIKLASYEGVEVRFETDLKEYYLNSNGELTYVVYNKEEFAVGY